MDTKKASLFFVFINIVIILQGQHVKLSTDKSTVYRLPNFQSMAYFSFFVDEIHEGEDLIASFTPIDWWADPNVFESATNQFPNNPANSEHTCDSFGLEVCTIPEREITLNKTFYFSVFCYLPCTFRVEILYEKEKTIQLFEPKAIVLDRTKQEGVIIRLDLPKDLDTDHVLITATPKDYDKLAHPIRLYLHSNDNIPTTSSFLEVAQLYWHEGLILSINKQNGLYCKGCTYRMLLVCEESVVVDFLVKTVGSESDILLNQNIFDFITGDQIAFYLLKVDSTNFNKTVDTLYFELAPYSGNPDLYINPGVRPKTLEEYRWKSQQLSGEILQIAVEDRNEVFSIDQEQQVYYIAIQSYGGSTYSLSSYVSKDQKELKFGFSETGYIKSRETINFVLIAPRPDEQNSTINIILESISGKVDLYIKSCPFNYQTEENSSMTCEFNSWEIENRDLIDYVPGMYYASANHPVGNEIISFENSPPRCIKSLCFYSISIYGNLNQTTSRYSITAHHSQKHLNLQQNVPMRNTVEEGEYQYYRFSLPNADGALSVHFQLTPITGASELYSAKAIEFPSVNEHQKVACGCSHTITYCGFNPNDRPLEGTYYLAVYGITHSKYSVTAFTRQQDNILIIQIINGVMQKFVFPEGGGTPLQEVYFKFEVNSDSPYLELDLSLNPIKGKSFKMYLANNYIPDEKSAQWVSYSNQLVIDTSDSLFSTHTVYGVKIVPYDPNDLDLKMIDTRNWQFTIQYTLSDRRHKTLGDNLPTHYQTSKSRPAYFQFTLSNTNDDVIIKLTEFSYELSMYLSWDTKLIYPNQNSYSLRGKKIIKLSSENIKSHANCAKDAQNDESSCSFYLGVQTTRKENIGFTIVLLKPNSLILLKEGILDQSPIPQMNKYIEYMLFPTTDDIIVTLESKKSNLASSFIVIDTSKAPNQKDWANRKDLRPIIFSEKHQFKYFTIPKDDLKTILDHSVVIIRVTNLAYDTVSEEEFVTISTSGQIVTLLDSHIRYDSIQSDRLKYFKISAKNGYFRIILTPLTAGMPTLYLNNAKDGFPTADEYFKKSTDPLLPSITVQDGTGEYFLMISSDKECSFSLIYTTIQENLYDIKPNFPFTVNLETDNKQFFLFLRETSKNSFRILMSRERGDFDFYVNVNKNDLDFEFPDANKHDFSNDRKSYAIISKPQLESSPNQVIILVDPKDKSIDKMTCLIAEEGSFSTLIPGITFVDVVSQLNTNKYIFEHDQEDLYQLEVTIIVTIHSGNGKLIASDTDLLETDAKWEVSKRQNRKGSSMILKLNHEKLKGIQVSQKNTIYFGIKSNSQDDCEYSIKIEIGKSLSRLQDGVLTSDTLNPKSKSEYVFSSPYDYSQKNIITITFALVDHRLTEKQALSFPELQIEYLDESKSQAKKVRQNRIDIRESISSKVFRFVSKRGLYFITVENKNDFNLTFVITMNSHKMQFLPLNNEMMSYLEVGQEEIYEINIPSKGKLHLIVISCFGEIEIAGANEEEYRSGSISKTFNKINEGFTYSLEVSPGRFYVKVSSKKGLIMFNSLNEDGFNPKAQEAAFKISAHFSSSSRPDPHNLFSTPDSKLRGKMVKNGEYLIEWEGIRLAGVEFSNLIANAQVENDIYIGANERGLNIGSKCEIKPGQEFQFVIENGEDLRFWNFKKDSTIYDQKLAQNIEIDGAPSSIIATVKSEITFSMKNYEDEFYLPVYMYYDTIALGESLKVSQPSSLGYLFRKIQQIIFNLVTIIGLVLIGGFIVLVMKRLKRSNVFSGRGQYEMESGVIRAKSEYAGLENESINNTDIKDESEVQIKENH